MAEKSELAAAVDRARGEDWASWSMPPSSEWFRPASVGPALAALANMSAEDDKFTVYNQLMDAFSHNHSGWVYAAAVPGAMHLARLAPLLEPKARGTALEVLADLLNFAVRDQSFAGPDGTQVRTRSAISKSARQLFPAVRNWLTDDELALQQGAVALVEAFEDDA